jgi:hypothetical protein
MTESKLRRQIAYHAARMMYSQQELEYFRAKQKAARRLSRGYVKPADLPSNAEIREQVLSLARLHEGDQQQRHLRDMRFTALRMMRRLSMFKPRLIGSVLTGHVHHASDIDLHVFSDSVEAVALELDDLMLPYNIERKRVRKDGQERVFTHIHAQEAFPIEITVYGSQWTNYTFKSSITGKAIERLNLNQFEPFLREHYPDVPLEEKLQAMDDKVDRFQVYFALMLPLENVKQHPKYHPEGDVLYHSLQVFDLARDELPYDEEFLLAALLHDIGKGIDPRDHVRAGLEALEGFITERTHWLIEHHMLAHGLVDGSLGARARRRLQAHPDFEALELLAQCDSAGRVPGVQAPELEEALQYLREMAETFG